jgi:3-hydroxyacyl-CoA dehydrogenase/enoyl-CoA hydratase/3-hydroxybutyryl-CoA epimerase
MTSKYKHWYFEKDEQAICWLHFDMEGRPTNVLSNDALTELGQALDDLSSEQPFGLIILSDKPKGFCVGADVDGFKAIREEDEALEVLKRGQQVFDRLESLPFPSLCLIHGFCLGGGMELALACRYRIACNDPSTRLGLPEVLLGIHPGWGGTMRLPRLIGAPSAMDLMLSGRTVNARTAKKLGMIDRSVPDRHLKRAAVSLIQQRPRESTPPKWLALTSHNLARPLLAKYLRKQVGKRVNPGHYPAPYALIDLWEHAGGDDRDMLLEEARSVARLITSETTKNLVRVFTLQNQLKSLGRGDAFHPNHVHVIGAGIMGGDIAAWCVYKGMSVTLQDREPKYIAPALKRAHVLFKKRLKVPYLIQAAMDRLVPDVQGLGIPKADIIIEAIIENLEAKQTLFYEIEPRLKDGALLATNTSSIPLDLLSKTLKQPKRLVGLHFFNPVAKMQLVEVVKGDQTQQLTIDKATDFCRVIDRLPLPVMSSPGFLVNRILTPYLMEAVTMLSEGVPVTVIDKAATAFGMPMGPIELADSVGLDICLSVGDILAESQEIQVPDYLRKKVVAGHFGRKSGQGFYRYKNGKRQSPAKESTEMEFSDVTDRLVLAILNEAMASLREGVVADSDMLDAGMIFGTGFAPFRGGPMHYVEDQGRQPMVDRLAELEGKYGQRFNPDPGWHTTT